MAWKVSDDNFEDVLFQEMDFVPDCYPPQNFSDVFGMNKTVDMLKENIVLPFRYPDSYNKTERAFTLYGGPGIGKTQVLVAASIEASVKLLLFRTWNFQSRTFEGDPDILMKAVFKVACDHSPCILGIDEIEVLSKPDRWFREGRISFLNEMHNFLSNPSDRMKDIIVVGVSQTPWNVDSDVRRMFRWLPGSRITLPDKDARIDLMKFLLKENSHSLLPEDFRTLSSKTQGYSGCDVTCLVRDALMRPVRKFTEATHFKKVSVKTAGKITSDCGGDEQSKPCITSSKEKDSENVLIDYVSIPNDNSSDIMAGSKVHDKEDPLATVVQNENGVCTNVSGISKALDQTSIGHSCDINDDANKTASASLGIENVQEEMPSPVVDNLKSPKNSSIEVDSICIVEMFTPCQPNESGSVPMSWEDVPEDKLLIPPVTLGDIEKALSGSRTTIGEEELQKMDEFESEFGCE